MSRRPSPPPRPPSVRSPRDAAEAITAACRTSTASTSPLVAAATELRWRPGDRPRRATARRRRRRRRPIRAPRSDEPGHPRHGGDGRRRAGRSARPPTGSTSALDRRRRARRASDGATPMIGRTLGQFALPTTFANVTERWRQRPRRGGRSTAHAGGPSCRCSSAGRSATESSYGPHAAEIADGVAERLGLVVRRRTVVDGAHTDRPASPARGASSALSSATWPPNSSP